jgi:hypothetical protein
MTKEFNLKESLKGFVLFSKKAESHIITAVVQSFIVYGAVMLLNLAAVGTEMEMVRVLLSMATEFFLEASILVFLARRLVLREEKASEWLDLHLKIPEMKVMGVQLLNFVLMTGVAVIARVVSYVYDLVSDKFESMKWLLVALTVIFIISLIVLMVFLRLRLYLASAFAADQQKGILKSSWKATQGVVLRMMWIPFLTMVPWFILSRLEGVFISPYLEGAGIGAFVGRSIADIGIQLCYIIPSALAQIYLYRTLVKGDGMGEKALPSPVEA